MLNYSMRKLLIIALLVVGCSPKQTFIPAVYSKFGVDFTKYSQKDFLFTPNIYTADYESKGLITLYYYPEANFITEEIEYGMQDANESPKRKYEEKGKKTRRESYWVTGKINSSALLDSIYSTCVAMGADAFTQLKITETQPKMYAITTTNPVVILGIKIDGYAIKRLGAFK